MPMLTCQKHLFSLPESVAYLNCAYMSPQLRSVEEAGRRALALKARPYEISTEDFYTKVIELRRAFAQLIGAAEWQRIAIIPAASYGLSTAARNVRLQAGQKIVLAGEQFPSNYYPWKRLADERGGRIQMVPAPDSHRRTEAWNEALLTAIDAGTKVVTLGNVHWTDGTRFDLEAIRRRSREVGALLVVDGTQSVGALPFDVETIQPDALICAGYKYLMGPYSIGLAYFGPAFDDGQPLEENWINRLDSEDFRNLVNYQGAYQPAAGRYSVGEQSNFVLVPMLLAAVRQLLEWQPAAIQAYGKAISRRPLERLREMGARIEPESHRCGHLFGIRLSDNFDRKALSVAFQRHEVFVSLRGDAIRVGPHVYNEEAQLDRLVRCFEEARRG